MDQHPDPRGQRLLRSDLLAALTTPHDVDRYLEQINPMWAAHEVRARIVEIRPETAAMPRSATIVLQPTRTWRGHRAGQYVQVGVELPGVGQAADPLLHPSPRPRRHRGADHPHRPGPRARPASVSKLLVRHAQARRRRAPDPGAGRVHPVREPGHADQQSAAVRHRRVGHHARDVDDPHPAARRVRRPGRPPGERSCTTPAARPTRSSPRSSPRSPRPTTTSRSTCVTASTRSASSNCAAWCPTTGRRHLGVRPAGLMELVAEAYDGFAPAADRVLQGRQSARVGPAGRGIGRFERPGADGREHRRVTARAGRGPRSATGLGCRMGICFSCTSRKTEGTVRNVVHRRGVLAARRGRPDLRLRPRRRLRRRPLTTTPDHHRTDHDRTGTTHPETNRRQGVRPRGHRYTPQRRPARELGNEIDAIRQRVLADLGENDADYIRRVVKAQRAFEVAGRALFYLPPAWPLAVACLSVSKILDNMEIGHNVMHGQYDWMGDPALNSRMYEWDTVCPSEQWKYSPQLHPPHLHQHPRQGPRHRLRHPADGRGPEVAPVLPRQPGLRVPAHDLLRVGRAAARPRGREHLRRASAPGRTPSRCTAA